MDALDALFLEIDGPLEIDEDDAGTEEADADEDAGVDDADTLGIDGGVDAAIPGETNITTPLQTTTPEKDKEVTPAKKDEKDDSSFFESLGSNNYYWQYILGLFIFMLLIFGTMKSLNKGTIIGSAEKSNQ